ncbi:MAG: tetratricopeptide repeat protein [Actinomycetota bacterium]|nr:tetratricopeptide repeat protein [Actinomycetota bacterium]
MWRSALLNLTGTGAGYLALGRWRRWGGYAGLTAFLLAAAVLLDASRSPRVWVAILGCWLVAAALDAARWARRLRHRELRRPWVLPAIALALVVVEAWAFSSYREAGHRALMVGLAAEARADCTRALDRYRQVTTFFELTLSADVVAAERQSSACERVLQAAQARSDGDFARAVALYDALLFESPGSVLVPHVRGWRAEAYREWGSQLRGRRDYERAIDTYRRLGSVTDDDAAADGLVAETYLEWGDHQRAANDYQGATQSYRSALTQFPHLPAVVDGARERLGQAYLAWGSSLRQAGALVAAVDVYAELLKHDPGGPASAQALAGLGDILQAARRSIESGAACDALALLDALVKADQPLRAEASAATPATLFSCGEQRYREGRFAEAAAQFSTLLQRFPNSPLAPRADAALVDAEVAAVQGRPGSSLPAPQRTGSAPGRSSVLTIRNESPRPIEILLSGPSSRRVSLERCAECSEVGIPPLGCSGKGPQVEIALEPGEYKVVAKVTDGATVKPFTGTWSLAGASRYSHCLYIRWTF